MDQSISQGSTSTGEEPANNAESVLFTEAFYVREAILAAPEDMTASESAEYFENIYTHFVSL